MIQPVSPEAAAAASAGDNPLGQLGSDAFLKLLVAQLKYQNPMQPTDGTQMLQQTAQFTTVETLQAMAEMNQQLMGFQQVTMGLGLVGKSIDALGTDNLSVNGVVESLRFTVDGPLLVLEGGEEVPMTQVMSVTTADPDPPEPTPVLDPETG